MESTAVKYFSKIVGTPLAPARVYVPVVGDNDMIAAGVEFADIEAAAGYVEWLGSEAQKDVTEQGWYDWFHRWQ